METKVGLPDVALDDLVVALGIRIAFIETGTATLRASDLREQGRGKEANVLTAGQQQVVARMERLRSFLLAEQSRQRMQQAHLAGMAMQRLP